MWNAEYRYRFCGLPTGVSMLPRLAAMVCNVITGIKRLVLPVSVSSITANGTNVISATSLVMNIELKKHKKTSIRARPRVFFACLRSREPRAANIPVSLKPATTSIRQKSRAMTL